MITMAPLYGGYAAGPTTSTALLPHRASILLMVLVLNALMTFYTYFKDYRGDRRAGKHTLVVQLGLRKSRILALALSLLPAGVFLALRLSGLHTTDLNATFMLLGSLALLMFLWTGVLFYRRPTGSAAYRALEMNFRACVCGQASLVAIFNPELAMWLFLFSYILVGLLFRLHSNPAA
jgi:geranylgeranylglycerol-phosphate geranylgeranyltransferase